MVEAVGLKEVGSVCQMGCKHVPELMQVVGAARAGHVQITNCRTQSFGEDSGSPNEGGIYLVQHRPDSPHSARLWILPAPLITSSSCSAFDVRRARMRVILLQ